MCHLFETIRIENGCIMHAGWHEARMAASRLELWNLHDPICLKEILNIPDQWKTGLVRCRITYGPQMESITFENYIRRPATSFKLIECNHIDYHLKRSDRSLLDDLFSKRGNCDEIIIVKEGVVTDTSVSNLIFSDGTKWYTPDMPLLKGTCRQRLLEKGIISERHIRPEDLYRFSGLKMINAMRYPDEETIVPVSSISM